MAGSNIHVLSVPSMGPKALKVRAGLLLDMKEGIDVIGARNAFAFIQALARRGVLRLVIPGIDPDLFRYPEHIPDKVLDLPTVPISRLHSPGGSNPLELVTLEPVQEDLSVPHMEHDTFAFRVEKARCKLQEGWSLARGRQDLSSFYGWVFVNSY